MVLDGGSYSSLARRTTASICERIGRNLSSWSHRVSSFGEPNAGRWGLSLYGFLDRIVDDRDSKDFLVHI
jgi:hypothetical protein